MTVLRRRWVLAPLEVENRAHAVPIRRTRREDDAALAELLDQAYRGTVDHDPDADHVAELQTWRTLDGADDDASFVATVDGQLVGASLLGRELGAPFLYEIGVLERMRGRGLARVLLHSSLDVLARRGEPHVAAWVTEGNGASETLLRSAGFVPVTPPVGPETALGYYRAAGAVAAVDPPTTAPLAVTIDDSTSTLWVVDAAQPEQAVTVRGVEVLVRHLDLHDPALRELAERAVPLRGAALLLGRRGVAPSSEVRRGAAVVVWRAGLDGPEFLVLHRSGAAPEGDWCWTPPSGGCEHGEELIDCAGRELREETGLELQLEALTVPSGYPVFIARAGQDAVVTIDDEHDDFAWVSADDAVGRCLPARVGDSIRAAATRIGGG